MPAANATWSGSRSAAGSPNMRHRREARVRLRGVADARGERELAREPMCRWLAEHATAREASFAYKGPVDAGGERDLVRDPISRWLAEHATATTPSSSTRRGLMPAARERCGIPSADGYVITEPCWTRATYRAWPSRLAERSRPGPRRPGAVAFTRLGDESRQRLLLNRRPRPSLETVRDVLDGATTSRPTRTLCGESTPHSVARHLRRRGVGIGWSRGRPRTSSIRCRHHQTLYPRQPELIYLLSLARSETSDLSRDSRRRGLSMATSPRQLRTRSSTHRWVQRRSLRPTDSRHRRGRPRQRRHRAWSAALPRIDNEWEPEQRLADRRNSP